MTLNKAKGRMFKSVGWTWNPIAGCVYECEYCWAKSLNDRWKKDFEPKIRKKFFDDKMPNDNSWIFVGSMGDVFCDGVPNSWIIQLISHIYGDESNNTFLLQTKNPMRFQDKLLDLDCVMEKVILGTTIETNYGTPWSRAPSTRQRRYYLSQMKLEGFDTFLSLEPLSEFGLKEMKSWIMSIQPKAIEIGLENYTNFTIKPTEEKIIQLRDWLDKIEIPYVFKDNLKHLEINSCD